MIKLLCQLGQLLSATIMAEPTRDALRGLALVRPQEQTANRE